MHRTSTLSTMLPRSSKHTIGDPDDFSLFRGAAEMFNALGEAIQQATTTTAGPEKVNECNNKATIESNIEVGYAVWASCAFSEDNFDPEVALKGNKKDDSCGFDVSSESFHFGPFESKEDALKHLSKEPSWKAINSSRVQDIIAGLRESKMEKEAANFNPFNVLDKEKLNELVALVEPGTQIGNVDVNQEEKALENQENEVTLDLSEIDHSIDESRITRSRIRGSMDRTSRRSRSASRSRAASRSLEENRTTNRPAGLSASVSPIPRSRPRRTLSRGLSPRRTITLGETSGSHHDTAGGCSDCTVHSEEPKRSSLSQARRLYRVHTFGSNGNDQKGPGLRRTRTLGETMGSNHDTTSECSDCTVHSEEPKRSSLSQARRLCCVNTIGCNGNEQMGPGLRRTRTLGETIGSKSDTTGGCSDCTVHSEEPKRSSLSHARRLCRVNTIGGNDNEQKITAPVGSTTSRKSSGGTFRRTKTQGDTPTRVKGNDINSNPEINSNKTLRAEDSLHLSSLTAEKGDNDDDYEESSSHCDHSVASLQNKLKGKPSNNRVSLTTNTTSSSSVEQDGERSQKKKRAEKKKTRGRSPTKSKVEQSSSSQENTEESKQRKEIRELYEVGTPVYPLEQMYPPELVKSVVEEMKQHGLGRTKKGNGSPDTTPCSEEKKERTGKEKKEKCNRNEDKSPQKRISNGQAFKRNKSADDATLDTPKQRTSNTKRSPKQGEVRKCRSEEVSDTGTDVSTPEKRDSASMLKKMKDLYNRREELQRKADNLTSSTKKSMDELGQQSLHVLDISQSKRLSGGNNHSSLRQSMGSIGSLEDLEEFAEFASMDPSDRRWMTVKLGGSSRQSLNSSSNHEKECQSSLSPTVRKTVLSETPRVSLSLSPLRKSATVAKKA